jgi:hypothetical protein
VRRVGHVAHMRETKNAHKILTGNLKRRDYLEYIDIDGKISECALGK